MAFMCLENLANKILQISRMSCLWLKTLGSDKLELFFLIYSQKMKFINLCTKCMWLLFVPNSFMFLVNLANKILQISQMLNLSLKIMGSDELQNLFILFWPYLKQCTTQQLSHLYSRMIQYFLGKIYNFRKEKTNWKWEVILILYESKLSQSLHYKRTSRGK